MIMLGFPLLHIPILDVPLMTYITGVFLFRDGKNIFIRKKNNELRYWLLLLTLIIVLGWYFSGTVPDWSVVAEFLSFLSVTVFVSTLLKLFDTDDTYMARFFQWNHGVVGLCLFFMFLQQWLGMDLYLATQMNPNVISGDGIRYPSFFSDPQLMAQFLAMGSFCMLIPVRQDERVNRYQWILFVLCIIGILYSGTRSAFIGLGAGLIVIFLFIRGKIWKRIFYFIILALCFLLVFYRKFILFQRGTDVHDTLDFRSAIWNEAFHIFLQHPILGIGYGNYSSYVERHYPDQHWIRNNEWVAFDHPESGYLKILTEIGVIGSICLVFFLIIPMIRNGMTFFGKHSTSGVLMMASIIAWLTAFYTVYSFSDIRMSIYVGIVFALIHHQSYLN
jgi:O-antigen ligase